MQISLYSSCVVLAMDSIKKWRTAIDQPLDQITFVTKAYYASFPLFYDYDHDGLSHKHIFCCSQHRWIMYVCMYVMLISKTCACRFLSTEAF